MRNDRDAASSRKCASYLQMAPATSPWKDLPSEVLEVVFTFLSFHMLCRTRLVCKEWNRRITSPSSRSLRARSPHRPSYLLLTPKLARKQRIEGLPPLHKWIDRRGMQHQWEILDMTDNRFYTLSDSFIFDGLGPPSSKKWQRYTAAADGDLIYAMYTMYTSAYHVGSEWHIVCNPVQQRYQVIPSPNWSGVQYHCDVVAMFVEPERFQIVFMDAPNVVPSSRQENIHVYDSKTQQWRKLSPFFHHRPLSCVFLEGVLYVLFVDTSIVPRCPKLYSCNLNTDEWSHVDVEMPRPSCLEDWAQLVVSSRRLFMVEYTGLQTFGGFYMSNVEIAKLRRHHVIKVKIWEVVLAKQEVVKVAEMPKYARYSPRVMREVKANAQWPQYHVGNPVVALGTMDSIVISSCVKGSVAWSLVRHCWEDVPTMRKSGKPVHFLDNEGICAGLLSF